MISRSIAIGRMSVLSPTSRGYLMAWVVLALLAPVYIFLAWQQGVAFEPPAISIVVVAVLISLGLAFGCLFGLESRVAPMLLFLALWLATRPVAFNFTYILASLNLPLIDLALDRFDKALGFDWLSWFHFVNAHENIKFVLAAAYTSMSLQMFFAIFYFSHRGENHKNNELWWYCMVGTIITTIVSGLLPAAGTFEFYGVADATHGVHLADLHAVRDGTLASYAPDAMKGIITLPSYHTVATLLLTYIYRGYRRMLWVIVPLNILQLIAIPSEGGHYVADMVAGALVAVISVWVVKRAGLGLKVADTGAHV